MEFVVRLPKDKYDVETAAHLAQIGCPDLVPLFPELLSWIQDVNWPVAKPLAELLIRIGAPLRECISEVLHTHDNGWKWSILYGVVSQSSELARALTSELQRIANSPTSGELTEELHLICSEILVKYQLSSGGVGVPKL